jgi:hypothetical protein
MSPVQLSVPIGADERAFFREGLENAPFPDVRRMFARSVTTLRTMGGPGVRRREAARAAIRRQTRRADIPRASARRHDVGGTGSAVTEAQCQSNSSDGGGLGVGATVGSPRWARIRRMTTGSSEGRVLAREETTVREPISDRGGAV